MGIIAILAFVAAAFLWPAVLLLRTPRITVQDTESRALLAGVWLQQSSSTLAHCRIELVLAPTGRYTERLMVRIPVTAEDESSGATIDGTHCGSWTLDGPLVSLSGDGAWPAYQRDLRLFNRVQ